MAAVYADPSLRGKLLDKAQEYERILNGDGRMLPKNQQEGLKFVIQRLRAMATQKRLKDTAFTEFRKLRETAANLCTLPASGEPRRFGSRYLDAGRVGGFAGAQ